MYLHDYAVYLLSIRNLSTQFRYRLAASQVLLVVPHIVQMKRSTVSNFQNPLILKSLSSNYNNGLLIMIYELLEY